MDNQLTAETWIKNCSDAISFGAESAIAEQTFWAYEALNGLCRSDPEQALVIICMILEMNPDERVLSNLAAGPLEDILVRHGIDVIKKIKEIIPVNKKFTELLRQVWTGRMASSIKKALNDII